MKRAVGALLLIASSLAMLWLHHDATDFPTENPVGVVDAALVERLRASPGLHLALAEDYELRVALSLEDDPVNRWVYGTTVDLRERRERQAIHIQRKGTRGAIHTDDHNPKGGVLAWILHASVDVPFLYLPVLWILGAVLVVRRKAPAAESPAGPDAVADHV